MQNIDVFALNQLPQTPDIGRHHKRIFRGNRHINEFRTRRSQCIGQRAAFADDQRPRICRTQSARNLKRCRLRAADIQPGNNLRDGDPRQVWVGLR